MQKQHKPKVSVLTPIYNTNPDHLRECIESILNQTFDDFEFIILNDSPDNAEIETIVKSYKDTRIIYCKNDKNIGITPSRNKLLDMARGEYIAIFDHDDISVPTRLAQEVEFLDKNPSVGVVSGQLQYFGESDLLTNCPQYDHEIKQWLTENCYVAHTAAMIRKSVLTENNIKYEEFYTPCEDYQLWNRLMGVTHFYNFPSVMVKYRCQETNTSHKYHDRMAMMHKAIQLEICNKFPEYARKVCNTAPLKRTTFRLRLFGFIPLVKVKKNWIQLFEFIPVCKIKRH